jgi:hypothetical protein
MKRNLALFFVGALALAGFTGAAPAGPGDSDPLGPLPHILVHAPASLARTASACDVYVHSHHFDCGPASGLSANGLAVTVLAYEAVDRGNGSWDEYVRVDLTGLNLSSASSLSWAADGLDLCEWTYHTGTATTTLN